MERVILNSLKDTEKFAKKIAKTFVGGEVVLLSGDLGAGKTTLTKYILKSLGVKDDVSSPTFTIMKEYKGKKFDIYHFDMYRLSSGVEAQEFGLEDYIYSGSDKSIVFIEWAENIKDILKGEFLKIEIKLLDNNVRELFVKRESFV